jgi:glycosyltransferase involved in cell wall biosynthesis
MATALRGPKLLVEAPRRRSEAPWRAAVVGLVDVTVVLPAYNEAALIEATVSELYAGLLVRGLAFEIVIVENGSSDRTLELSRRLAENLPRVRVISRFASDYGAALHAGFTAALGTVVVSFDVDYFDVDFLDEALDIFARDDAAIVVASKRCAGARDRRPPLRRLLTWAFTGLLGRLVAMPVSDAHGMKAFIREPLRSVLPTCALRGSLFDVEMIVRAGEAGLVIREVPAVVSEVRPCRSPVWRRSIEAGIGILRLRRALRA